MLSKIFIPFVIFLSILLPFLLFIIFNCKNKIKGSKHIYKITFNNSFTIYILISIYFFTSYLLFIEYTHRSYKIHYDIFISLMPDDADKTAKRARNKCLLRVFIQIGFIRSIKISVSNRHYFFQITFSHSKRIIISKQKVT